MFEESALNTFSSNLMNDYVASGFNIINTQIIETRPLCDILTEYIPNGVKIDFMSIDVEGEDANVLKSNDWERYRPNFVLVEILSSSPIELIDTNEYRIMTGLGYEFFAKSMNTVFFKNKECVI